MKRLFVPAMILVCLLGLFMSRGALADNITDYVVTDGVLTEYRGHESQVTIPSSLGITAIGSNAFRENYTITSVTIPTGVRSIGANAFFSCTHLAEVSLPDTLVEIKTQAFRYCAFTSLSIPEGVTQLERFTFTSCRQLQSIHLPASLVSIADNTVFNDCTALTTIECASGSSIAVWAYQQGYSVQLYDSGFRVLNGVLTEYVGSRPVVYIPGSMGITAIGMNAFMNNDAITEVHIPDGVTSIGQNAFYNAYFIHRITLPDTITSIGKYAFYNCRSLEEINLPETITSIPDGCFSHCESLPALQLPAAVTSIDYCAFFGCSSLTAVELPLGLLEIGSYAFRSTGLDEVIIPQSVTHLGDGAFRDCEDLIYVRFNAPSITFPTEDPFVGCDYIANAVWPLGGSTMTWAMIEWGEINTYTDATIVNNTLTSYNGPLTSLTIPGGFIHEIGPSVFQESGVTSVTLGEGITALGLQAFRDCHQLTSVTLPQTLQSIGGYAFHGCDKLTTLALPESLRTIGDYAIYHCDRLTSLTLPSGLTSIGRYAFANCYALTSLTVPGSVTSIGTRFASGCRSITSITFEEGITSLGQETLYSLPALRTARIPGSVTEIDDLMINSCNSSLTIQCGLCSPAWEWARVPSRHLTVELFDAVIEGGTLVSYTGNRTALWPPEDLGLTAIGERAFQTNTSVQSVKIPEGVTQIGAYAFNNCYNLTTLFLPSTLDTVGRAAFRMCRSLQAVAFHPGLTSLPMECFWHCEALTQVSLPYTLEEIGQSAFAHCYELKNVILPDGIITLDEQTFRSSGLTTFEFPESVSAIPDYFFSGCSDLTSVRIPDSVIDIAEHAFYNCSSQLVVSCNGGSYAAAWAAQHGFTVVPIDMTIQSGVLVEYTGYADEVQIPSELGVTAIGDYAFEDAHARFVQLPPTVTSIGNGAFRASYIERIALPQGLTSIGNTAFMGCVYLTSVNVPEGITRIDHMTFYNCVALESVYIADSVTYIETDAFEGCTSLTTVYVDSPNSFAASWAQAKGYTVVVVDDIEAWAFSLPWDIEIVEAEAFSGLPMIGVMCPYGLQTIGPRAFANCENMRVIYIPASVTSIASNAFTGCPGGLVIIGANGTYAQTFAQTYGYQFKGVK